MQGKWRMKKFYIGAKHQYQQKANEFIKTYQKMNGKSSVIMTRNHSETSAIKIKHHSVVTFEKLTSRLRKYRY